MNYKQKHSDIMPENTVQLWDIVLDGEIIGSVHGQTEQDAKATVAPLRLNLEIRPHKTRD